MNAHDKRRDDPANHDQRATLRGLTWSQLEAVLAMRGDQPSPRLTYLDGTLELTTPSRYHESIKTLLARLVELYSLELGIDLSGYGSWTLVQAPRETAIEPDECYIVGSTDKDVPDLAIEVVWTSGGLNKLEAYRRLGVREVWIWKKGVLGVYALRDGGYEAIASSEVLPEVDLALIAGLAEEPNQSAAARKLRDELRRRAP